MGSFEYVSPIKCLVSSRILYVSNNAGPKKVITLSCQPHLCHLIGCKPHEVPQNLNLDVFYTGSEIKTLNKSEITQIMLPVDT